MNTQKIVIIIYSAVVIRRLGKTISKGLKS